jgi:hypothetical protein
MSKITAVILAAFLLASCRPSEGGLRPSVETAAPAPLRLYPDEVEFWQRLMERDYQKGGFISWERAALSADRVILELRKRNGRY